VPGSSNAGEVEEIQALVEQELEKQGKRGALRVEGSCLVVGRGAAEARTDIQGTIAQWENLPQDLRDKRVTQIAQLLTPGPVLPSAPSKPRAGRPLALWSRSGLAPIAIVLATGAALVLAYRFLAPRGGGIADLGVFARTGPAPSTAPSAPDPDQERAALASTACEQSRARVARGANVGPADVEGWVVELVLLRRSGSGADLASAPELGTFIQRKAASSIGSVVWSGAKSLSEAKRFDAQVEIRAIPSLGSKHLNGVSLVFSGPYVAPYFSEDQRADYFVLADALSSALQVTDGALFAHCVAADAHHIGSWFLGVNPGAAVSSVVYFMADFSEAPLLKPDVLGLSSDPLRHGHAFDVISSAAESLDRGGAAALVGAELGMISGRPNQPVRVTFPFRDANRATRASIAAARALKLANSG
jgi:serine/threonine-protein kinase